MGIEDLDRIRFVTRHFRELQGFRRLVPAGLVLLSLASLTLPGGWLLPAALFAGACLFLLGAGRYYRSAFGETESFLGEPVAEISSLLLTAEGPAPRLGPTIPVVPRFLILGGVSFAVFVLFQLLFWPPWVTIGSEVVNWTGDPALTRTMLIQMLYGLCGLFFLGTSWLRKDASHPLGIGLLLGGFATLGPWLAPATVSFGVALLVCGSALVLAGLLDHWQLVRTIGPREEE